PGRRRASALHGPVPDRATRLGSRLDRLRVVRRRDAVVRQARHPRPVVVRRDRGRSTTRRAADRRHRGALPGSRRRTAHHRTNPRAGRNESRLMDITETTAPKSDQQNYEDYIGGPKTVTISEVKRG